MNIYLSCYHKTGTYFLFFVPYAGKEAIVWLILLIFRVFAPLMGKAMDYPLTQEMVESFYMKYVNRYEAEKKELEKYQE
jgi:hypothetical protein